MKSYTSLLYAFFVVYGLLGMNKLSAQDQNNSALITGHFADSRQTVTLTIKAPPLDSTGTGCVGGCITRINASDPAVPPISVEGCIGGTLANLGDLNGDGLDELGLLPGWFAGCWRDYRVYTFKHKHWELAVPPFPTHCNEFEAPGVTPITKDANKPGYVLVTYSV